METLSKDLLFTVDGNNDFAWYTDPTDQHDFTALSNEVMRLSAAGNLTITGTIDGRDVAVMGDTLDAWDNGADSGR